MEKSYHRLEKLEEIVSEKLESMPNNSTDSTKCRVVVIQKWEESEEDWGERPDGFSLHLNLDDRNAFVKEYWDGMPDMVQSEYSRPYGKPYLGMVDDKVFARVEQSKNGIRTYEDFTIPTATVMI